MNINTQRIEEIIKQSISSVSCIMNPFTNESTTIGEIEGVQVQILVTSDVDEFTDEISLNNTCINEVQEKPELGVDCVIWCNGEPKIDRLTDKDHFEPYWEDSLYTYGDEDCFMVLEKPVTQM